MSGLKVVCLISGGKDSLFSILHCLANGHDIIALANLHPPYNENREAVDDLDSYMYQTIGHTAIPLFEKALGLPLYRQDIVGSAVNQDKCYGPAGVHQNDETEALIPLLRNVMAHHPEVNAVSTGAILSDYQRTRVESVAMRLGLTPLSYLWQYPFLKPCSQTSLLEDMAAVGQDSRIVKVASGGLDSSFLWENVADPRTISRLDKASKRFGFADGGAVLGEGGEYETLAVAGPAPLWKGRIVVHDDQRKTVIGDAGSASVQVWKAQLETKDAEAYNMQGLRTPSLLEPRFQTLLENLRACRNRTEALAGTLSGELYKPDRAPAGAFEDRIGFNSETVDHTLLPSVTGEGSNASEEMHSIMDQIKKDLQDAGNSSVDVAYTSIILRDMTAFPAINAVYGTYFMHANPPARVTIACAGVLPPGKQLMVSFTFVRPETTRSRKGLHVQSRSYWAPANIGPYSQAISVPSESNPINEAGALVYIAGQIPLSPASMELAAFAIRGEEDDFLIQTVLALQHAIRIGRAMQVRQWGCAIAFIVADSSDAAILRSNVAQHAWEALHQEDESSPDDMDDDNAENASFDVWDVKYGPARIHSYGYHSPQEQSNPNPTPPLRSPSLYVVRVDALPRSASIEWVTYGSTKEASTSPKIPHFDHLLQVFEDNIVLAR